MSDDSRPMGIQTAQLAVRLGEHFGDLLRMLRIRDGDSNVYNNPRFSSWLATEARAVVESGLEADPWSEKEIAALAERIRAAVLADRSGVRRVPGSPVSIAAPERENVPGVVALSRGSCAPWVQLATAA